METIRKLYRDTLQYADQTVTLSGWVRNNRGQKAFGFIDLHDGSFFKTVQVVYEAEFLENFADVQKFFDTMPNLTYTVEIENPKTKVKSKVTLKKEKL